MKSNREIIEKIREQYTEKEKGAFEELIAVDKKVKRPARIFAYAFGGVSALVAGSGMSLTMTKLGASLGITAAMPVGIAVGSVGFLMCVANVFIYRTMLASRRKKYAAKIVELSERLQEKSAE